MTFKPAIAGLIALLCVGVAQGATIRGNVYEWSTLEPLNGVIIEIDTVPRQTMVVKSGIYIFSAPPGKYTIESKYFKNNLLEYHTIENLTIAGEGDFILDIIMFPALDVEEFFESEDLNIDLIFEDQGTSQGIIPYWMIGFIVSIGIALYIYRKRSTKKSIARDLSEGSPGFLHCEAALPEDLSHLFDILEKNDGRMTQKELRKQLDLSEAKISLMVTDLESRGLVKRVKKGRGNVIIKR